MTKVSFGHLSAPLSQQRKHQGQLVGGSYWCSLDWNLHSVSCWAECFYSSNSDRTCVWVQLRVSEISRLLMAVSFLFSVSKSFTFVTVWKSLHFVVSVYIQAVYVPLDFVLLPRNRGDCLGDFCELGWNSCLVLSCCVLSFRIHISAVHLNSIDHKGTRWQTYNELRSKGIGCKSGFSLLTTIATETVKWNSQVTVSRDSGARREAERERERETEGKRSI